MGQDNRLSMGVKAMTIKKLRKTIQRHYEADSLAAGIVALSEETDIPMGTLTVVAYGHMTIDAERALRIADALEVPLGELMPILRVDAQFLLRRKQ